MAEPSTEDAVSEFLETVSAIREDVKRIPEILTGASSEDPAKRSMIRDELTEIARAFIEVHDKAKALIEELERDNGT